MIRTVATLIKQTFYARSHTDNKIAYITTLEW